MADAMWIWLPGDGQTVNEYVDFLSAFDMKAGTRVEMTISAGSHYAVWLNGLRVPSSQYADYPDEKVSDTLDITRFAVSGRNRLAIQAYCQGESSFVYRKGPAALWFQVTADGRAAAQSDQDLLCRQSLTYVSGPVEKVSPQLSFSFRHDLRRDDGWRLPGYAAEAFKGWQKAAKVAYQPRISPRPIALLEEQEPAPAHLVTQGTYADSDPGLPMGSRMQYAALAFVPLKQMLAPSVQAPPAITAEGLTLTNSTRGIWGIADMGCERSGLLTLDVTVPEDCQLLVGYGEHLDDGRVRTSVGGRQFACSVHLKAGRNQFLHPFKRLAGRYLMFMADTAAITLAAFSLRETPYPVVPLGALPLTDHLDQRIRDVSIRTLILCMHEHYEDCPWREQALYAMDSRLQMLSGYYAFRGGAFARASLKLLAQGQKGNGLLEICAPAEGDITIPSFALAFVLAVDDYRRYTGDRAFIQDMLPVMERLLNWFLALETPDHLLLVPHETELWHFYEWQDGLDGRYVDRLGGRNAYEAPLQALCVMALSAMADMSGAARWAQRADGLRQGLSRFYDARAGAYRTYLSADGTQLPSHYAELTQALLLLSGACDAETAQKLRLKLRSPDGSLIVTSLSYRHYKYEALLTDEGNLDHVINDIRAVWGRMLAAGATSFWETERGAWDFDNAGSLCHGWSAIPVYFYGKYLLGIREPQQ